MKEFVAIVILIIIASLFIGFKRTGKSDNMNKTYNTISASEAKEMMDSDDGIIIVDVREKDEYIEGHIENAILIPLGEVESKAEDILKDKDQTILVYCRSGRRSEMASQELAELGYTNIYDFGGIMDWDYEVVR